ncbi:hypothetical protein GOP47_0014869 [Adiantum capillus-veneris]|uniref:O-fucosyltransferase family protein n=1 Tax=Adiantum capillus-veneris TaxID=13818 RepID=A0A9D4ZF80_ADICA|nr:hypothetical protein GOP47_0014869 [Adiantum capillus-veneris]
MIQPHQTPSPPPSAPQSNKASSKWLWWQDLGLRHAILENLRGRPRQSRVQVWLIRLSTCVLLWTCLIQLMALAELWHPRLFKGWPPCFDKHRSGVNDASASSPEHVSSKFSAFPPPRLYKSNGYLLVSCNGGLNQMRAAICDMVAISRYLNLTLVVPELDKTSFWADPSDFKDIFDVDHFIFSLQNEVRIVKRLPQKYYEKVRKGKLLSMPPISWSNESYYLSQILPLFKKHKVIRFSKTDTRLANNGLPVWMQKLRCRVNYEALKFTPLIERLGQELVNILLRKGSFVVLHLRYEMDMLAFSGCTHGCTDAEVDMLTKMRFAYPWWKEKIIDSVQKRLDGLCPLTPEETALVLKALGFHRETQIYIAAGEIYGSKRRMASLHGTFPNIVRKEMLLFQEDLKHFQNHSSQMAALDYLVAVNSDVFIPTYDGNMAKVVSGHRRYLGHRKTILLDRQKLVVLLDQYKNGTLDWMLFAVRVQEVENDLMGAPRERKVISERPKEEDYFYANPVECLL